MILAERVPEMIEELRPYMAEVCEVSLADWQWNPNSGAWVKFRLPDESHLNVYAGKNRAGRTRKFGQRYHMMLIEINDDEVPMEPANPGPKERKPYKLSQLAGMMCADEQFRHWITHAYGDVCHDKDQAADLIRQSCGIESRSLLDSNEVAAEIFRHMLREFDEFRKGAQQ